MALPPLPEEFELNWFSRRNAFDIAVKDFIEGGGGGGVSSWDDLEDKPAVIAAGATAEAARANIGAMQQTPGVGARFLGFLPAHPDPGTLVVGDWYVLLEA